MMALDGMMGHPPLGGRDTLFRSCMRSTKSLKESRPMRMKSVRGGGRFCSDRRISVTVAQRGVGMDMGTSRSSVAVIGSDGRPRLAQTPACGYTIPSVVYRRRGGGLIVGDEAERKAEVDPENAMRAVKRTLSKGQSEDVERESNEARGLGGGWLEKALSAFDAMKTERRQQEAAIAILKELARMAGMQNDPAVIAVPTGFQESAIERVEALAKCAGIDPKRVVREPVAAAVCRGYELGERDGARDDRRVMVVDIGAGTTDAAVLDMGRGVYEEVARAGDACLGGMDFDDALLRVAMGELEFPATWSAAERERLLTAAERAKESLGRSSSTGVALEIPTGETVWVRREEAEDAWYELARRCGRVALNALDAAGGGIEELIVLGGGACLALVRREVERAVGKRAHSGQDGDVAKGAAVLAGQLAGSVSKRDAVNLDESADSSDMEALLQVVEELEHSAQSHGNGKS